MTAKDAATLTFKAMGLYFMLSFVRMVEEIGSKWTAYSVWFRQGKAYDPVDLVVPIAALALITTAGVILWVKSRKLANAVFPSAMTESSQGSGLTREDVLDLGLGLIGVWLLITNLPSLFVTLLQLIHPPSWISESEQARVSLSFQTSILAQAVRVLFGAGLIGWKPVGRFLKQLLFFQSEPGPQIPLRDVTSQVQCPYCREPLTDDHRVNCPSCATPYHDACWQEHGGCAILGCQQTETTREAPPRAAN